jgi:hypothetical protein
MVKEVRSNRDFSDRTITTARWARDQIKRQIGKFTAFLLKAPAGSSVLNDDLPVLKHN